MTASRHRRLARTGGHPPRRAPASKCAPRVNARFCRSETHTAPNWMFCESKHYRPKRVITK